jgi:hypothetical protein
LPERFPKTGAGINFCFISTIIEVARHNIVEGSEKASNTEKWLAN